MPELINHLPQLIADYKKNHPGTSQGDIATAAGIHPVTLSRYVHNQVNSINLDVWRKLCRFFRVPGHAIFDIIDEDIEGQT